MVTAERATTRAAKLAETLLEMTEGELNGEFCDGPWVPVETAWSREMV